MMRPPRPRLDPSPQVTLLHHLKNVQTSTTTTTTILSFTQSTSNMAAAVMMWNMKKTYNRTSNENDPVHRVAFFNPKKSLDTPLRLDTSVVSPLFTPSELEERTILCFVKKSNILTDVAKAFREWKAQHASCFVAPVPIMNSPTIEDNAAKRVCGEKRH
eukprot:PhM_4_TR2151/c0_g1_i1/m.76323